MCAAVNGKKTLVTYQQWSDLIQDSFEKCYYVPLGEPFLFLEECWLQYLFFVDRLSDGEYRINSSLVNRRGIYKDVYGSGKNT